MKHTKKDVMAAPKNAEDLESKQSKQTLLGPSASQSSPSSRWKSDLASVLTKNIRLIESGTEPTFTLTATDSTTQTERVNAVGKLLGILNPERLFTCFEAPLSKREYDALFHETIGKLTRPYHTELRELLLQGPRNLNKST